MGKVGIMGGTFDPIHNGHILIGRQAYEEYQLDEIWYMPSGQPPHKRDHRVTDARIRGKMTRLAIEDYPYFRFSDFEIKRQGNSYTAQTLQVLTRDYPEHIFYFIVGADSLFQIETWYHPETIMELAVILAAGRDCKNKGRSLEEQIAYLKGAYHARIQRLHSGEIDVSSAELRSMAANGISLKPYVPPKVLAYIESQNLYMQVER
ncbi:nicotinate-nucleotide adenylyltransferase [Lachnospiraceae bacterium 62-35]